jgi:hypothetical protein
MPLDEIIGSPVCQAVEAFLLTGWATFMKSSFASRYANARIGKFQFRLRQETPAKHPNPHPPPDC